MSGSKKKNMFAFQSPLVATYRILSKGNMRYSISQKCFISPNYFNTGAHCAIIEWFLCARHYNNIKVILNYN